MANIHEITLDVKKSGQTINEPIVIRTDDTDDVIEVHVKQDGLPYSGMTSATFYGTKQDMTIIANDPATVNNDVITYSVPKEIANIGGKIKNAYFMIDGKISTENFIITILKTVNFKGESKDYIPGLNSLVDKWNATSKEWNTKLNGIDQDIKNLSMSEMLKNKMDVALAGAKSDYMSTFNKSVDNLNNVVTELSGKESIATDKGKELDDAIAKVNQSISDVNAWLVEVQNKITTANKEFTDAQRKSVSDVITQLKATIADTQKTADNLGTQLTTINDNIKAINVPDLNASVKKANDTADSANTTANNAIAKFASLQTQVDNSAVGTNLLTGTSNDIESATGGDWLIRTINYFKGEPGKQYTASVYLEQLDNPMTFEVWTADSNGHRINKIGSVNATSPGKETLTITAPNSSGYQKILLQLGWANANVSGSYAWRQAKLEKGSVATDWCPNPSDIATNGSVQTSIKNALDKADYSTNAEVDSKISTGVGQAKTYAEQSIKDIIGAAPDTLDTIAELADAVTENKDGVQAINDAITVKADKSDVDTKIAELKKLLDVPTMTQAEYDSAKSAGTLENKFYIVSD